MATKSKKPVIRSAISKVVKVYFFDGKSIDGLSQFIAPSELQHYDEKVSYMPKAWVGVPAHIGDENCHHVLERDKAMVIVRWPNGIIHRFFPEDYRKNFNSL